MLTESGEGATDWKLLPNASQRLKWHQNKGELKIMFFCTILFMGEFLNGYDGTILGGLLALPAWHTDLGNPNAAKVGLLNAAAYIVGICMGPVNSYVADTYGRRWPIRWFGLTMIVGTVLGCVAGIKPSIGYGLFVASKAIIGSGITTFLMTAPIVMQEITHPRNRSELCALWSSMWMIGNICAAWVTFGTSYLTSSWSWRIPYLVQLLPAVYLLVASYFVPETPRFLMAKGRSEEAFRFLVDYHGNGDEQDALVLFEFEELKRTLKDESAVTEIKWKDILNSRGNRHRLALAALMTFMPQMNGANIIYFYYSVVLKTVGISSPGATTGMGAGMSMMGFLVQLIGVWSMKRLRRRTIVLVTWPLLMVGLAALAITGAIYAKSEQTNTAAGIAGVAMVWLFLVPSNFSSPLFYSYPSEILNYAIRGKGMAVWNTVNQGWGAYGSFVNSVAMSSIGWKYYLVYLPIVAVQWVLAYFFMVETKGYTLEEIALAFGDHDAAALHAVEATAPDKTDVEHDEHHHEAKDIIDDNQHVTHALNSRN